MRPVADSDVQSLYGSRSGDVVVADAWYDGELVADQLPVSSWRLSSDRSRQVQTQGALHIVDTDGALDPWAVDDPLNVGGPRIRLTYMFGSGGEVPLGEYRTTTSQAAGQYVLKPIITGHDTNGLPIYAPQGRWLHAGVDVQIQVDDLTYHLKRADFLGPETVRHTSSVLAEVDRLCDGHVAVETTPGVEDASVPSSITYEGDRMDAIGSLLRSIDAEPRMSADGVMEIIPTAPGAPVWDVAGGEEGVLIDFSRSYHADDLVNIAVVEGRADDDRPLIGISRENSGPLRWDGPHGQAPFRRQADILRTQARVDRAAATYQRQATADRAIVMPVTCLPHPGIQVADVVNIHTPAGTITGPVETVTLSGNEQGIHPMALGVSVPLEVVQAIGQNLRGT